MSDEQETELNEALTAKERKRDYMRVYMREYRAKKKAARADLQKAKEDNDANPEAA